MKKRNNLCVQCCKPIDEACFPTEECGCDMPYEVWLPFCKNSKCPNYGLLQTGILPARKKKTPR